MQSFNFKQGESLDIVSTTKGLFLLTPQFSVKNQLPSEEEVWRIFSKSRKE